MVGLGWCGIADESAFDLTDTLPGQTKQLTDFSQAIALAPKISYQPRPDASVSGRDFQRNGELVAIIARYDKARLYCRMLIDHAGVSHFTFSPFVIEGNF